MINVTTEIITDALNPGLPPSVQEAYAVSDNATIERLSGGRVNDTFLVEDNDQRTIMRRLAHYDHILLDDANAISEHLSQFGWEAPSSLPTIDGGTHVYDEAGLVWHRMPFIASDGQTPTELTADLASKAAAMLGDWHATVQRLDYEPQFSIPHFHDTDYYAARLVDQLPFIPGQKARDYGRALLHYYDKLPETPRESEQLIHGDPKLDNMLFRNGEPFTLIDFDTVMKGSKWTDVGDFLRSLTGKLLEKEQNTDVIELFTEAYLPAAEVTLSVDEATHAARSATARLAVTLGMRYLNDIVDPEKYFSWDPSRYRNRQENHTDRAEMQLWVAEVALKMA